LQHRRDGGDDVDDDVDSKRPDVDPCAGGELEILGEAAVEGDA
jgi:hypothetical protein